MHQRATRRANSDGDLVIDANDVGNLYYYDSSWRIDDSYTGSAFSLEKIVQRIWDPLYIDALIAMQTDVGKAGPPDGDFIDSSILYSLADRKYDVIAMMTSSGAIPERVRYIAYGVGHARAF